MANHNGRLSKLELAVSVDEGVIPVYGVRKDGESYVRLSDGSRRDLADFDPVALGRLKWYDDISPDDWD